jgi:hypothetical protein
MAEFFDMVVYIEKYILIGFLPAEGIAGAIAEQEGA